MGSDLSEEEIQKMMNEVELNDHSKITYKEFVKIIKCDVAEQA